MPEGCDMTFDEYRAEGRVRYAAFVDAVCQILAAAVDAQGMVPHAITGRAKHPDSLAKKLKDRGIDPASAIDEQLKDLAGCRVVFLTNAQVERLNNTGAIRENFEVIDVNVHHPVPGTETETRLFDSTNYFVQLKPDRLALPEYSKFAGIRVEIQIQTLLNHAWAEMGHDTIYKEPDLRHVDQRQLASIKQRMDAVMRDHLLPAGHDFDKIARDFDSIVRADRSVDSTIAIIEKSTSNDELLEALNTLDQLILPHIAERAATFVKLTPMLVDAVERMRGTQAGTVDTIFGPFAGMTGDSVARAFSTLLDHHRFVDLALTFETLVRLYIGAGADSERKIWTDLGAHFADHDLQAWKARGPVVQQAILDGVGKLGAEQVRIARGLITAMLGKVLAPEVSGTTRGALNTILIHTGSVGAGNALREVRTAALDVLERLIDQAEDDGARREVIDALRAATTLPYYGGSEELRVLVMEDASRVAAIERTGAPGWGLELRRQVESAALRVYRNFHVLPVDMSGNEELVAAQHKVVGELSALRDALNADGEYAVYKALIGHDSVRPTAWDDAPFDPTATAKWREQRHAEIAATIGPDDADHWIERVRRYLAEGMRGTDIWPMADFIGVLAETKPDIAVRFLEVMDEQLAPMLVKLLLGLDKTDQDDVIRRYAVRWIGEGRFLVALDDWLSRRQAPDVELLATVGARARELADDKAVVEALNAAGRIYQREPDPRLVSDVFMPSVEYLTKAKIPDWIHGAWGLLEGTLVAVLDEEQARQFLRSFVDVPKIDYDADRVLAIVAERFPEVVLDLFETRITRDRDTSALRIEPVPFDIHDLRVPLARQPRLLIATVLRWYSREPLYHEFRGGRLIGNVFPTLVPEVVELLGEVVGKGQRDGFDFVLATLLSYDGAEQIFPLCMDVIDRLDEGDDLLGRVSHVLGERGVMSGEFGRVEADALEHERLKSWLGDPRPKVQAFAKAEMRRIEQSMAWEQRRAERDVEQMKRDWGEPMGQTETAAP